MDLIGDEIRNQISAIGRLWRFSEHNPKLSSDIIEAWDRLVLDWIEDKTMPLIVRRSKEQRGHTYYHPSGREIVVSDNTVAIWISNKILNSETETLTHIKEMLEHDEFPITFAFKKNEIIGARYTKTLGKYALKDWKVCHIDAIGLNTKANIEDVPITVLEEHFRKYASPKNMFLLPQSIGGLGEISEFINEQK